MSRIQKRLERIRENPKEVKWDEMMPIFNFYGINYEEPEKGSHWVVWHDDYKENISVPVHNNRVKAVYVRRILELIDAIK